MSQQIHARGVGQPKILVVSLEFTFSPFSGNGLYCRSLVRALLRTDRCSVAVLCAKPHRPPADRKFGHRHSSDLLSADHHLAQPELSHEQAGRLRLWPVELPPDAPWKRLDEYGPWQEFVDGAARTYANNTAADPNWRPDVVLAVDWHGGLAWRSVAHEMKAATMPKVCCFNFRVYSSGLCPTKAEWYDVKERQALRMASDVVCLSRPDMRSLERLLPEESKKAGVGVSLIHPALRGDMHLLAEKFHQNDVDALATLRKSLHPAAAAGLLGRVDDSDQERRFVTCAVRLSKEKNPMTFVEVMIKMRGTISRLELVPLLCGAASDEEYAKECRDLLRLHYPNAVVIEDFLGPEQLASIFAHTFVNIHPCAYDAFGMTAVEASAFGAPSIINCRDVGAAELLQTGGYFQVDFDQPLDNIVGEVDAVLANAEEISNVREEAYRRAMSWDEDASGQAILKRLTELAGDMESTGR